MYVGLSRDLAKKLPRPLKKRYWSQAFSVSVSLVLTSQYGQKRFVLGRRKWKSTGGYPTLAHGELSVLEMASPFIELVKAE